MKTLFYYGFCLLLTESLGWAGIVMVYDVAVIGAGVVGAMIARELMKYELSVCLLEAEDDVAMGASRANSGIVHAGFDAMPGSLKAKLNVQGSAMMEEVARELGVNYQRNGSLVVGFDEPDKKTLQILYERGNQNGVAGLRIVSDKELHDMEPNITVDTAGALYAPTGAIVCPYGLTIAAAGNAMDNGAELYTGFAVKEITTGNEAADGYLNQTEIAGKEAFFVLSSEHRSLRARYIVNAAGLYADTIARMVGDDSFAIHPRKGEYLLFLNNDVKSINPDWLEEMLGVCQRPEVGGVGAKLIYPDNTIQHAGCVIGMGGIAGHMFVDMPADRTGYLHKASLLQDMSAVTAACLLMKKEVFEQAGGFTEELAVAFNDVDLCLKVRKNGYLIVYDPYAKLYHMESKTRGAEDSKEKVRRFQTEIEYMRCHWIDILKNGDPCYNKNLSLTKWNYSLKPILGMETEAGQKKEKTGRKSCRKYQ